MRCNTHAQSGPDTGDMPRMVVQPYRYEPTPVPATKPGFCEWCETPLSAGREKFCSDRCARDFRSFLMSQGPRILAWQLKVRALRPQKKGASRNPQYTHAQNMVRDLTDEMLTRIRDARRAARARAGRDE